MWRKAQAFFKSPDGRYFLLIAFFFVFPVSVAGISIAVFGENIGFFRDNALGILLFYGLASIGMAMALVPSTFMAIASGYLYGWQAFPLMVAAYMFAAVAGLFVGRFMNKSITGRASFASKSFADYSEAFAESQFLLLFFVRLSPIFTFASVNMAVSRLRIRWIPFLSGTLLGMLPRTALFFFSGLQAASIHEALMNDGAINQKTLIFSIFLLLSVLGLILIFIHASKRMHQKITNNKTQDHD